MHTEISPWIEKLKPHRLTIATGGALLVLLVALIWVAWRWGVAEDRMELMQKQAEAGFLQAPSSTRTVRVDLRAPGARVRSAAATSPSASISASTRARTASRAFA